MSTMSQRPILVKEVHLEYLVAAGESDRSVGKGLAHGGADTSVIGIGWRLLHNTKHSDLIQRFSDDLKKQDIPIVFAVTMMDVPGDDCIILSAHEFLYHPNNKYTILSATQMREHGVDINDKAKHHGGIQNIVVDKQEIPIKFKRSLLHVPIRNPTKEELQLLPLFDITSDSPWDPKDLGDEDHSTNHFRGDSMCHNHVTKLGKEISTDEKTGPHSPGEYSEECMSSGVLS